MSKKKKDRSGKAAVEARKRKISGEKVRYRCLECGIEEDIPRSAIEIVDILDDGLGDPEFECKQCKGTMQPIGNDGPNEVEYIVSNDSFVKDDDDFMF